MLLRLSRLNIRLRNLQVNEPLQLTMYGDSIYPRLSHLRSGWRNANPARQAENKSYAKIRISIEWNYGLTANLFGYLRNFQKLKILGGSNVHKVYTVCTILRNCHVALYGSETSEYFGIEIERDMLEKYTRAV